jgi:ABC-2 type transport system ATP-binding protein
MGEPIIHVEGLKKRYGNVEAVRDLNLDIGEGEIFGFIGPNGAGKTTTIRILATLLTPTAGLVRIAGYSLGKEAEKIRALIGYMPDSFGVYEEMLVLEYLEFFAAAYGIRGPRRTQVVDDVLQLTELSQHRMAVIGTLSRGQQQRLGLARVLVHDPKVLLLDEPASGLDPRARIEIRELIRELGRMGKTVLLSSHILPELATLCTRIGIIEKGGLLFQGTVPEALRKVGTDREVEVGVDGDGALARAELALTGAPGVLSIRQAQGHLRATLSGEADVSAIPEHLLRQGFRLNLLKLREIDLEDVFLRVTKGAGA